MKTLLYLHGLGSSAASRKFTHLQLVFGCKYMLHCPEWTYTTNITLFISNLFTLYEHEKSIVILGSSTGGNFAYQLADRLRAGGVKVNLLLINPLLSLEQRISGRLFPLKLKGYIQDVEEVKNCTLILSNEDDVLDHSQVKIGKEVRVITIEDNHQISNTKKLMFIIKRLLKKKRNMISKNTLSIRLNVYIHDSSK